MNLHAIMPESPGAPTRREFLNVSAAAVAAGSLLLEGDTAVAEDRPISNDTAKLTPRSPIGERLLKFDFPALRIGVAEYPEGPTGCTVFHFANGALGACDVRGGSPGGIMAGDGWMDALCFAGGSLYGLEAAAGVASELFETRRYSANFMDIGLVRGAIIYDFGPRKNTIYPDKSLGRAALKAAQAGVFPLGRHGAGCSATVGKGFDFDMGESSGQGGAFHQAGPTKVAVFTVVNAMGAIVDRNGRVVRGHLDRKTGKRLSFAEILERKLAASAPAAQHGSAVPPDLPARTTQNTTLTAVITNQKLDARSLGQMAKQVHASLWRCLQPFHGLEDGDTLYAITTNELENANVSPSVLSALACETAWDAVLSCFEA